MGKMIHSTLFDSVFRF